MRLRTVSFLLIIVGLLVSYDVGMRMGVVTALTSVVYIRADGSVDPSTAPIQRNGDLYTLTQHLTSDAAGIVVERNNIVIDGNGYTLQGNGNEDGISLQNRGNVTVRNMEITAFLHGIWLYQSAYNNISGNKIKDNGIGINLCVSSNCNNVFANNITTNNGNGISLWGAASGNNIYGNELAANGGAGIELHESSDNNIFGNSITDNNREGIWLNFSSSNNTLCRNNITDNGYGIMVYPGSSNNTLKGNNIATSGYNFGIWGYTASDYINDVDASNTVNGKPIYYWISRQEMAVPLDAGYVALVNCRNITVKNLDLAHNQQGVLLIHTTNSTITENNITDNDHYGIKIHESSDNSVSGNNIAGNNREGIWLDFSSSSWIFRNNITDNDVGIELDHSSNNIISENNITDNQYGIRLADSSNNRVYGNAVTTSKVTGIRLGDSSNNTFYHNNLVNNTQQVYSDNSTNVWDDGYPSGGNYWSDFDEKYRDASELEVSGIWSTPYTIDENNRDNYPLMNPMGSPRPPAEIPFWMQWWVYAIVAVVIVALGGAVYFLKKRKPSTPEAPI